MSAVRAPVPLITHTDAPLPSFSTGKQFSILQPSERRYNEQLFCFLNLLLRGVLAKQKIQRQVFLFFFRMN